MQTASEYRAIVETALDQTYGLDATVRLEARAALSTLATLVDTAERAAIQWMTRAEAAEGERDLSGAALGEPCAECGHIDWRSDGYLDDVLARERAARESAERERDDLSASLYDECDLRKTAERERDEVAASMSVSLQKALRASESAEAALRAAQAKQEEALEALRAIRRREPDTGDTAPVLLALVSDIHRLADLALNCGTVYAGGLTSELRAAQARADELEKALCDIGRERFGSMPDGSTPASYARAVLAASPQADEHQAGETT